jgi:hypothetical protein
MILSLDTWPVNEIGEWNTKFEATGCIDIRNQNNR